jgi:3-hydroxyisobutyrate dehydrogenase-like beta-hydroxyacid dehydrogenase
MGLAMARNLLGAGFPLVGAGARAAAEPAALAAAMSS